MLSIRGYEIRKTWEARAAFSDERLCATERFQRLDAAKRGTALTDADFARLVCLPDTVDPRK